MDSKSLHAASTAVNKLCVLVLANNMYEEEGLFGGSFIGAWFIRDFSSLTSRRKEIGA